MKKKRTNKKSTKPADNKSEPKKKAGPSFRLESLEPRILLSSTWAGTEGNDTHTSASGGETAHGHGGDDTLHGSASDDTLFGDGGDDTMDGNGGNDSMDGGSGDDVLRGEGGNDSLFGGEGDDQLFGGSDHDSLDGGAGNDMLKGDSGNDTLIGGEGNDSLIGGSDHDTLTGGVGHDVLKGDGGNDIIDGGDGNDQVFGGSGNDSITTGEGDDIIRGDGGNDIIDAGAGNDTIRGGSGVDTIHGSTGDDTIYGDGGNDVLYGDDGDDTMHGGSGADTIHAGAGNDTMLGESGNDTFDFSNAQAGSTYHVDGGKNNDTIDLSTFASNNVHQSTGRIDVDHNGGQFTIFHSNVENIKVGAATNNADSGTAATDTDTDGADDTTNTASVAEDGSLFVQEDSGNTAIHLSATDLDEGDAVDHYVIDSVPDHGSLMLNGNAVQAGDTISHADITAGNLQFAPEANWHGDATINFHAHDGETLSINSGTFTIHVEPVNDGPLALSGSVSGGEDSPVTISLSGSDSDSGDQVESFRIDALPEHGTLALNGNPVQAGDVVARADVDAGNLTFNPDANWNGATQIQFSAGDGEAWSAPNTVEVNISAVNDIPSASDTTLLMNEDGGAQPVNLSATDPDAQPVDHYEIDSLPEHGSLMLNGNAVQVGDTVSQADVDSGNLTFQPEGNWNGSTTIGFRAVDAQGAASEAGEVAITVAPVNDAPTDVVGSVTENPDGSHTITLSGSDPDAGDAVDHFVVDEVPENGTLMLNGNAVQAGDSISQADINSGNLTFVPSSGYSGDTNLSFHAVDGSGAASATESLGFHVEAANETPVADAGTDQSVVEGSVVTLNASQSHDADAGDSLTYNWVQVSGPTVTLNNPNSASPTFTAPNSSDLSNIRFEVTVSDGDATSVDTVDVEVMDTGVAQIRNMNYSQFRNLTAEQVDYLTPEQIASIPNTDWFATMSAQARASLDQEQVQALNTATVSIGQLTPQQREWLTPDQIQDLSYSNFRYLTGSGVDHLTPAQIATIPNTDWMATMSADARASLDEAQVQALNTATVSIGQLTPAQREWLTPDQIQDLSYSNFRYLSGNGVDHLTPQQIATIPNTDWMATMSAEARASLDQAQVQALNTATVSIGQLTPAQREWLTPDQIQDLSYSNFRYLSGNGVDHLTPSQIATIPNTDWMATMSADARGSLDEAQVQALNTATVSIGQLTPAQREWLTPDQIQDLSYSNFRYLSGNGVDHLTPEQIATIPNTDWMATMSADARGSLDEAQVQALNTATVSIGQLTPTQREWLTPDQIQDLSYSNFRYLSANGVDHLTPAQIATIPNTDWMATMSASARGSLDEAQVQAIDTSKISIGQLTAGQREWLTTDQIQDLSYSNFRYVPASRIPELTPAQISTIPNTDWFNTMSADARNSLTHDQILALGNNLSGVSFVGTDAGNTLTGNSNVNKMLGMGGDDTISGGDGTDVLDGGTGNDTLSGGGGRDLLISGGGNDVLNGGDGNDTFRFTGAQNGDVVTVNGGTGTNTLDLSSFDSDQISDNGTQVVVGLGGGQSFTINYTGISQILTSDGVVAPYENHAPLADGGSLTMDQDGSALAVTLSGTVSDAGDAVESYRIETMPEHGSLLLNGGPVSSGTIVTQAQIDSGALTFTPESGYAGDTSFTYRASDGEAWSASAGTFAVSVTAAPTPPPAEPPVVEAGENPQDEPAESGDEEATVVPESAVSEEVEVGEELQPDTDGSNNGESVITGDLEDFAQGELEVGLPVDNETGSNEPEATQDVDEGDFNSEPVAPEFNAGTSDSNDETVAPTGSGSPSTGPAPIGSAPGAGVGQPGVLTPPASPSPVTPPSGSQDVPSSVGTPGVEAPVSQGSDQSMDNPPRSDGAGMGSALSGTNPSKPGPIEWTGDEQMAILDPQAAADQTLHTELTAFPAMSGNFDAVAAKHFAEQFVLGKTYEFTPPQSLKIDAQDFGGAAGRSLNDLFVDVTGSSNDADARRDHGGTNFNFAGNASSRRDDGASQFEYAGQPTTREEAELNAQTPNYAAMVGATSPGFFAKLWAALRGAAPTDLESNRQNRK